MGSGAACSRWRRVPYQWVPVTVLESIVDESAGITWDKISNVLSNLVSYRGLLEYSETDGSALCG